MRLADFDYTLPDELIAQYPLKERDAARLIVVDLEKGEIEHAVFKDVVRYLHKDDLLVLNDTKVIPARILGRRVTGGKIEILLLRRITEAISDGKAVQAGFTFEALLKPGRLKLNETVILADGKLQAQITGKDQVTIYAKELNEIFDCGKMPLPPYIKREVQESDSVYYQTIYACDSGSVAAPTAGLHFTEGLIQEIKSFGINLGYVTLHVGHATFKPVKSDDITEHQMGYEHYMIPQDTLVCIEKARANNSRIIAVGTTTLRTLETYASTGIREADTNLFIYSGYRFNIVNCLLTNFHLPRTTLFMLVCAFGAAKGKESLIRQAYQEAIDRKYRFYSYGDAMLII